jgi:serine/threonine protein kinase/WD40 repeat protein
MSVTEDQIPESARDSAHNLADELIRLAETLRAQSNPAQPCAREQVTRASPELTEWLGAMFSGSETQFLSSAEMSQATILPASLSFSPPTSEPIGDFRLLREIGRGGMGVVYEAEQISLGRRVALKVFPFGSISSPHQLQRFQNEVYAAASLHHSNIVPVFMVGSEGGVHFYAMQFIEGLSLATFIRDLKESREHAVGALPQNSPARPEEMSTQAISSTLVTESDRRQQRFRQIAEWGVSVADALDHTHSVGIIHRDIKPANLLLDPHRRVWITDFGIAHIAAREGLTRTGDIVGSLPYASPEQAAGKPGVDRRTDVYSLGATLYELITLQPLYAGDRPALLRQIMAGEPTPILKLQPRAPAELATIVQKAIEPDLHARYQTAAEMADDLRRYLQELPIRAKRPRLLDRIRKWSRRNRGVVRFATVMGLFAVFTLGVCAFLVEHQRQQAHFERESRLAQEERMAAALRLNRYVAGIRRAGRALKAGDADDASQALTESAVVAHPERLNGFEWFHLRQGAQLQRPVLGQHQGMAYCAALSPAGDVLATGGRDGVRLWDLRTHQSLGHLPDHQGDVNGVAFSQDGNWLASSGDDGLVRIHETKHWQRIQELPHDGAVVAAKFVPGRNQLVTAERHFQTDGRSVRGKNVVRLWDTQTWTCLGQLQSHRNIIHALDVSSNGELVASCSSDGEVILWSLDRNEIADRLEDPAGLDQRGYQCVKFAHQAPRLAISGDGLIRIWDFDKQTVHTNPFYRDRFSMQFIAFSPDDDFVVAGGDGTRIFGWHWPTPNGDDVHNCIKFQTTGPLWSATFLDDRYFVTTGRDGAVRLFDTLQADDHRRFPIDSPEELSLTFAPDSRSLWAAGRGVHVLSIDEDRMVSLRTSEVFSHLAVDDRRQVVSATRFGGGVRAWSIAGAQELAQTDCQLLHAPARLLDWKQADRWLVQSAAADWQVLDRRFRATKLPGLELAQAEQIVAARGANRFAVMTTDRRLELYAEGSKKVQQGLGGTSVVAAAMNTDGTRLALGRFNGIIQILDTLNLSTIQEIVTDFPQASLSFSQDGQTLASCDGAAKQSTVYLWNVATGQKLLGLETGCSAIRGLTFSPDGRHLAAAGLTPRDVWEILLWSGESPTEATGSR